MKKRDVLLLVFLMSVSGLLIAFSSRSKLGAYNGLVLAENTIIPSLLPVLIIFMLVMKTSAKDVVSKAFGLVPLYLFRLPSVTSSAILFGLIGGYPTGALLTYELMKNEEIDEKQARCLLRFNFCGGCGFIITGVGVGVLHSQKAGVILFLSSLLSSVVIGAVLSVFNDKPDREYYSYSSPINIGDALNTATSSAMNSVLNITAYIILFSAIAGIVDIPKFIMPVLEITNGVCKNSFSLAELSAYLSFGGLCIHLQLLPIVIKSKMKYLDFLLFRVIGALLSYVITRIILFFFPVDISVFSNISNQQAVFSSLNMSLSFLMIVGAVVLILDINERKRIVDKV